MRAWTSLVIPSILSTRVLTVWVSRCLLEQGFHAFGQRRVLLQHFDHHAGLSRICAWRCSLIWWSSSRCWASARLVTLSRSA